MKSCSSLPEHLIKRFEEGNRLRSQGYRGRYAPSPTGALHLGNLRTALLSWLRARLCNGIWILRVDDLDCPRNRPGAIDNLQNDLDWLGLHWDGPVVLQSERRGLYGSVLSALRRQGKLYPCRCSRRTLSSGLGTRAANRIYPGTCRKRFAFWGFKDGRLPSWRLRVHERFAAKCGDVLIKRSDGCVAYHLSTVVDELTLGITEVIRGHDLVDSLPYQLAVIDALGQLPGQYLHAPLMRDENGFKLSKRDESQGLDSLRSKGICSEQIVGFLAATLKLVPFGSELSADELLSELMNKASLITSVLAP